MSSTANVLWWFNLGKFFQLKARETFNIFSSIALRLQEDLAIYETVWAINIDFKILHKVPMFKI